MEAYRVTSQFYGAGGGQLPGGGIHTRVIFRDPPQTYPEGMDFSGVNSDLIGAIERELTARVTRSANLMPLVDIVSVERVDPVMVLDDQAERRGT